MSDLGFLHGGDYNPEQWLNEPEILEEDIRLFKKAKINTVTLGVFSWAVLEPKEGVYNFDWLEQIINRLYEEGIHTILATPSGARPKWLAEKYPEVLRVGSNRTRNLFGGRHNHCYTSPVYREKIYALDYKLAERFGKHPAVLLWHLSNELSGDCHCPLCQQAFRQWLKEKYQTIEKVNESWGTVFWSHTYQNFDQIESPATHGEMAVHGLNLDWKRFVSDQTKDFVKWETKALRDAGSTKQTTINLMYYFNGLDYFSLVDNIDIVSWDNYPTWHKGLEATTAVDVAMMHDLVRSTKKKPFLLMESTPSSTNWQGISKLKKPGMHRASSLQAVAHGADSVLYFQLRQSRRGSEKFHGAVIDHYGKEDTRVFQEVAKLGEDLEALKVLKGTTVDSEVAIVYDWENKWAMEDAQGPRNKGLYYKETIQKMYQSFRKQGINVDFIDGKSHLEGYKIVVAPMLYLQREAFSEEVKAFVKQGGIYLTTYWSSIVDETDTCYLGGTPHGLMEVLGLRSKELDGLYDEEYNEIMVDTPWLNKNKKYRCKNLCDIVDVSTAEVLGTYQLDFYKGTPAVTKNNYGQGQAFYICTDLSEDFYDDISRHLLKEAHITPLLTEIPEGVEVSSRMDEENIYIFIQNFNRELKVVTYPEGSQMIYGNSQGEIPAFGTSVLKIKR